MRNEQSVFEAGFMEGIKVRRLTSLTWSMKVYLIITSVFSIITIWGAVDLLIRANPVYFSDTQAIKMKVLPGMALAVSVGSLIRFIKLRHEWEHETVPKSEATNY